jgi:hypothetical protein
MVFIDFSEPDLHNHVCFFKTRAFQPCSPTLSALAAGSTDLASSRCPKHGLHVLESPMLFGARDGHAPPFSGRAWWSWGLRRLIYGCVVLVTARAFTPRRLRRSLSLPPLLAAWFCWFFSSFVLCIPLFLMYSLSVYCSDFIRIFIG